MDRIRVLSAIAATAWLTGCMTNPRRHDTGYVKAAALGCAGGENSAQPQALGTVASLGFDSIVLAYHHNDTLPDLEGAAQAGLGVFISMPAINDYVLARHSAEATPSNVANFEFPAVIAHHPAFRGLWVAAGGDTAAGARSASVCGGAAAARIACLRIDEIATVGRTPEGDTARSVPSARPRRLAGIDLFPRSSDQGAPYETVLGQYHRALLDGATDGIVVRNLEHYFSRQGGGDIKPTQWPAVSAAVTELCARATHWGRLIAGADASQAMGGVGALEGLAMATLRNGRRRCILAYNSSDRFLRGEARISAALEDQTIDRAVPVPTSRDRPPEQVHRACEGYVALPIALRPHDAALYELF